MSSTNYEFSLVITTYNRFDNFLINNIPKYLNNPYISEIIISDDCSDDYDKLINVYANELKIKIIKQPKNLGALKNKITACTYATKDWICLMDSDNYCDIDYFDALVKYWQSNSDSDSDQCPYPNNIKTIYAPVKGLPVFDFTSYIGQTFDKNSWNGMNAHLMNIGNNVFHKSAVTYLTPILDENIEVYAIDVKYMNYILFKNNMSLIVVPNMQYNHSMHNDSLYIKTASNSTQFDNRFDWTINN